MILDDDEIEIGKTVQTNRYDIDDSSEHFVKSSEHIRVVLTETIRPETRIHRESSFVGCEPIDYLSPVITIPTYETEQHKISDEGQSNRNEKNDEEKEVSDKEKKEARKKEIRNLMKDLQDTIKRNIETIKKHRKHNLGQPTF